MKTIVFIISAFFLTSLIIVSCTKDKTEPAIVLPEFCKDTIRFSTQVKTIFDINCSTSGCHDVSASGGYRLETYDQISTNADIALEAMKQNGSVNAMPLGSPKLNDSLIQQLECWIAAGKENN